MGPLEGLRVLDLSPNRVGAQVSQLFADFGADVTWVEPPGGAALRQRAAFPFWARGKRSIALDLRDPSDREVVAGLARSADVLVETFRPGVMQRRGLGYDALREANPRLVYASITGFGREGPDADLQGYEGLVMARIGGFSAFAKMAVNSAPPFVTAPFASFPASQLALHGILAALLERERSGLGQQVETSLVQGFMTLDTWSWFEHLIAERWPEAYLRSENYDARGRPMGPMTFFLLVALTKDGRWLQFACVAPHLFQALMKALGLSALFTDPDWKGLPLFGEDVDKRMAFWTKLLEAANAMTLADWERAFAADPDVFAELFRFGARTLDHPQLLHDAAVVSVEDAECGPVRQPGALVAMSRTPAQLGRSAPVLDDQRSEILAESAQSGAPAGAAAGEVPRGLPLEGVTVLELAYLFAAPHGATLLSDLGARVIKVEPLEGDPIRTIISFPESGGAKVMQGKESICVDMTTPEGLALVHELAARADVVLQGFRAGAVKRLGVDFDALRALNPRLIYVNAPGYGVDGPYGGRPAYAPSIGAATGIARTNVGSSVPERAGLSIEEIHGNAIRLASSCTVAPAQADGFAALGVATAILAGLVARERGDGSGQELFTSMLRTGAHAMSAQAIEYPGCPEEPGPDALLRGLGALYRIYDTREGWVFLAAPSQRDWERLIAALASDADFAADARFADAALRRTHNDALAAALAELFLTRSASAWEAALRPQGVGCVVVATEGVDQVLLGDGLARQSGFLTDVCHPSFDEHPRPGPYLRLSRSAVQALPGVLAGNATDALLQELARDAKQIADLRERKIVG